MTVHNKVASEQKHYMLSGMDSTTNGLPIEQQLDLIDQLLPNANLLSDESIIMHILLSLIHFHS